MRLYFSLLFCLMASLASLSAKNVSTDIDAVTVYQQGARVFNSGYVDIPAGTSEIVLDNLSASMVLPSVQVWLDGSATILSVTSRLNQTRPTPPEGPMKKLTDSIEIINSKLEWIQTQKSVYEAEEGVLNDKLAMVGTTTGLPVAELEKLVKMYRVRLLDIKKLVFDLEGETKKLTDKRSDIEARINDLNNPSFKVTAEVVVTVMAKSATRTKVKCDYLVSTAGWSPSYDLRAESTLKPVKLNTYAQVYQSTGMDWKGVKLTVSTGYPMQDNSRPVLVPLYVDFYAPMHRNYIDANTNMNSALYKENILEAKGEELNYNVDVRETQLNVAYDIEMNQTINADGKTYQVPLKEYTMPAVYVYHTVPKMVKSAFLLAKIPNWGQYNLIAGKANLFFEDVYIGQSDINPQVTADTLLLSLGRDDKVNIQRTLMVDKEGKKFIGGDIVETRTYEISVRNNKSKAITIEVLDQIPVSKLKEIKVTLLEQGEAEYTAEIGKLLWNLELAPGETKKVRFSFEVTYPKDKPVSPF